MLKPVVGANKKPLEVSFQGLVILYAAGRNNRPSSTNLKGYAK